MYVKFQTQYSLGINSYISSRGFLRNKIREIGRDKDTKLPSNRVSKYSVIYRVQLQMHVAKNYRHYCLTSKNFI